ncbi:MAG: hypothetical protein ACE5RG_03145, partial [Candidatus Nitrosomaritimum yanchengensis]
SVFVPTYTAGANNNPQELEFVSNSKSKVENLTATDPCSNHWDNDAAQVQIPYEEEGYYLFWSLKGKPQNGKNSDNNVSNFTLAGPQITHICNVTEAGSIVAVGDSDITNPLTNFTNNIVHENVGGFFSTFELGETVYDETNGSIENQTDIGDERLANSGKWLDPIDPLVDGSVVDGDDTDLGQALERFVNGTEMYSDTDSSGGYSIGEPIYDDSTGSIPNVVDAGDTRLYVIDGSEALSCEEENLITGAGAITDKDAFKLKNGSLERWEDPNATKQKGKNNFVDMTGLLLWSGALCDAAILENATINTIDDGMITIQDFDPDGVLEPAEIDALGYGTLDTLGDIVTPAENAAQANGQVEVPNDKIDTEKEFAAFMEIVFGDDYSCKAIYDEWVFNLAQIVNVGLEIINDGATTVQMRFYPVATTEFTPQ